MTLTLIKYIALAASIFCVTAEAQRPRWSAYRYRVQGLVGFYGFEQGGTAPKDFLTTSTGTLYGDTYVGTVAGSDTASGAIFYDGTGDYTLFTTAQAHRDAATSQELTYFTRFRKTDTADNFFMMRWGFYTGNPIVNRYLRSHSSGKYLALIYAAGVDYTPVQSGETDEHTYSCTHSESDSNLFSYLDGAWINTQFTSTATFRADSAEFQISGSYSTTHSHLDGQGWVSEFRLYDYALTSAELMKLHQEGDHK